MSELGPFGYSGGLNTKAGPFTLPKDQMSASQNVNVLYGVLKKINGSSALNTVALNSGASIIGLADWQTESQSRYLIIIAGSKIYQALNFNSSPSDITGGATITAGNNNQHTFASLNNILAICGGTTPDTPLQWTGSGNVTSLAGSPPTGNLVTTANNFMFISGVAATPSRIFWSNVSDPGTWSAANNLDFRKSDGDIITAIAPLNYNLIIFKRRSTGILYTQTNTVSGIATLGPLTQINLNIGCAGSQAWDILPDGRIVVFGSDSHLYIFDGSTFEDISDPPLPSSNIQPTLDNINITRIPYACVKVYPAKRQVWLAASTGSNTTNDSIFIYDYELKAWQSQVPDRAANIMITSIDSRSAPKHPIVLLTGNYGGFVYEHDTGTTNAENSDGHIDGYATMSNFLGVESREFIPRSLRASLEANTGQLQVGWGFNAFTDISNAAILSESQGGALLDISFFLDISKLGGSTTIISVVPLSNSGTCFTIQIQFRNVYASQPFTVHPYYLSDEVII